MKLVTSNLAIRFYVRDGWTEEKITPFILKGYPEHPLHLHDADNPEIAYYIPNVGTRLDIKKLLEVVTKVERTFNDHPYETDEQFLQQYNW